MKRALCLLWVALACAACGGHSTRGTGAAPRLTRVPDVLGLTDQQAVERLARAGLCPGIAYAVRAAGSEGVSAQDPSPGARLRVGATVHFTVATTASAAIVRGTGSCPNPFDGGTVLSP